MPLALSIKSDGVLERVAAKLAAMPAWMPQVVERHMPALGSIVAEVMEGVIEPNRYTGSLQTSILSRYDPAKSEVSIYPSVLRGQYDGGAILELGTGPIPHAPWGPIAEWAAFRGLPAFPIWYSIREHGVKAHPFLKKTADDQGTVAAMNETATRIAADAALEIVSDSGTSGASISVTR